ncbi:MAG: transposase [Micropruina sp.]
MPRHARQLADSGIYHAMARGVNRDAIFLEDEDFEYFLHALAVTKDASGCHVLAYCLMSNHVHLVLRVDDEPISAVMKRLGVRYAGWFNRKYGRAGHLFQDRFRSRPVETDEYFMTLLRYVWNNPVEAGLVGQPEEYRWSSRRLFGHTSSLIDGNELEKLLPDDSVAEPARVVPQLVPLASRPGRRPERAQDEVNELLGQACGAASPQEFLALSTATRRTIIKALRTRSVPYAQIASATGMSTSGVRRLHLAGELAPAAYE